MNYFEDVKEWLGLESVSKETLKSLFITASEKRFSKRKDGKDTVAFLLKELGIKADPDKVDQAIMNGDYSILSMIKDVSPDKIEKIKDEL
jgi:hypothetical protein